MRRDLKKVLLKEVVALFARRVIDSYLRENQALVSEQTPRDRVQRLNTVSDDYVATEWELVLLSAFAKHARKSRAYSVSCPCLSPRSILRSSCRPPPRALACHRCRARCPSCLGSSRATT